MKRWFEADKQDIVASTGLGVVNLTKLVIYNVEGFRWGVMMDVIFSGRPSMERCNYLDYTGATKVPDMANNQ
jgi:hypothetical protein